MNSVAWVFLPYFAFLGVIIAGVVFMLLYDPKPELKIICSRTVYDNCEFYTVEEKGKENE